MCGIVAQFSKNAQPPDTFRIKAMADDIQHRGPDDEGFYFGNWYGIGFKRLSIMDISQGGHQPMFDEEKNYLIVYNGELYNFKSIRQELIGKGYSFFSNSDTEVVLKSFIEWNKECLSKFIGMFAFIIVDLVKGKVFVARDQLGIKPLYFYQDKNNMLFASEIKCFRHFIRFELNVSALYEQFFFRYVSGRRTIFKDIHRLPPGSYIEFDKRGIISEFQYYDVTDSLLNPRKRDVDLKSVEDSLKKTIYSHTQSDVGYNVQLSGGVDSSYIVAVLSKDFNQDLNTFSCELKGHENDESKYQKYVADRFKTNHHSIELTGKDLADSLHKATWHLDIPISGGGSSPFLMLLNDYAKQNSKVILAAEGSDELFSGYDRYSIPLELTHILKQFGLNEKMFPDVWKIGDVGPFISQDIDLSEQIFLTHKDHMKFFKNRGKNIGFRKEMSDNFSELLEKVIASDQTSNLQFRFEVQDKMGMASSVEVRVPFCVPHLFDLVNSFRPKDRITPVPKYILKKCAESYFDDEFIYRRKIGFHLPTASWLRDKNNFGSYFDLLTDNIFKQRGFYNSKLVAKAIDEHLKGEKDYSKSLSFIIHFEIWHRMFIDKHATSAI
jgi:asparagine synthase (glutamine-hydrolysing)